MLSDHQKEKKEEVLQLLREGHKIVVIEGSAGTGKTYLVNELIKAIKQQFYKYGVTYVSAPTHKALNVLKSKIEPLNYVQFTTVHSGLKMRKVYDDISKTSYFVKPDFVNPKYPPFARGTLLIVDEASMIGNRELNIRGKIYKGMMDYIEEFSEQMIIIYLGDRKQLPPVNEETSPVFTKNYPIVTLTEIVRQGKDNPIIKLSNNLNDIFLKVENTLRKEELDMLDDGMLLSVTSRLFGYTYTIDRSRIVDRLAKANGTVDYKYLAYHNDDVDDMNRDVRQHIYGSPNKLEQGEMIVLNAPYGEYNNNEEIKIETLDIVQKSFDIPTEATKIDSAEGELIIVNPYVMEGAGKVLLGEDGKPVKNYRTQTLQIYLINKTIPVIHEIHEQLWNSIFQRIVLLSKNNQIDYKAKDFLLAQIADFKYAHAITVHKSQGSTYKNVFINIGDIRKNRSKREMTSMLYTAITRASDLVIMYNVK